MTKPRFSPYAKALTAGITTLLGSLQLAYIDSVFTTEEWISIALATFAAAWGTYAVPNTPAPDAPPADDQGDDVDPVLLAEAHEALAAELRTRVDA